MPMVGSATGAGYQITDIRPHRQGKAWVVDATFITLPQVAIASAGVKPTSYPRSEIGASFLVESAGGSWKLLEWQRVER
ncbi:MAG: hypothetical protein V9E81_06650 [Marmoricola sp.]